MATESIPVDDSASIFKQLDEYPWNKDREFQGGLSAILGPNPNPTSIPDLTIRAQCFYLSRKRNIHIDYDAYRQHLSSKEQSTSRTTSIPPQASNTTTTTSSTPRQQSSQPSPTHPWSHLPSTTTTATTTTLPPSSSSPHPPTSTAPSSLSNTTSPPPTTTPHNSPPEGAPYPKSFAEIVSLITSGQPIPGIIEYPTTTAPHLASKPVLPKRRKPWEKDETPQEQVDGKIGGVFGDHRDIYIPQELPDEDKA